MNPVAVANATTFLLTSLLLAVVLVRRPSRSLDAFLLALLGAILVWSGGAVWRALPRSHEQMLAAHHLVFLGVSFVPVAWLLLALAVTRVEWVVARPVRALGLVVPSALLYVGFVTNPAHGAFARIEFETFERGPLFWMMIAWAFTCSIAGTVFILRGARWLAVRRRKASAVLLAISAIVPQLAAASYLFHLVPWPMDPTPAALGVSAALLYPVLLRMRTFEQLPLLRRDVIEHLPDAVLIADPTGTIVDLNPEASLLVGGDRREDPIDAVLSEFAGEPGAEAARSLTETGVSYRADLPSSDGGRFRLQASRVAGADGSSAGYFLVLHDRSDEIRADQALRRAQRLDSVGMLAAGIAHEVNNPLSFVRANLAHLSDAADIAKMLSAPGAEEAALLGEMPDVLSETQQGVDRIAAIVSGMQRLAGREDPRRESVDPAGWIDESLRLLERRIGKRRPRVRVDADLPPLHANREELVQLLLNLLVNAEQAIADAHGSDGCTRLTARRDGEWLRLDVEDDGPGVAPELLERIFDPFFTTRAPDQGTGLGLAIAHELARHHGGSLEAGRSDLGGARFTLRLPTAREG